MSGPPGHDPYVSSTPSSSGLLGALGTGPPGLPGPCPAYRFVSPSPSCSGLLGAFGTGPPGLPSPCHAYPGLMFLLIIDLLVLIFIVLFNLVLILQAAVPLLLVFMVMVLH